MEKERIIEALTEAQLRNRLEPEKGVFIAESPKVIRVALDAGYEPLALLCERKHLAGDAADILARCPDIPVYTGGRELLARLTGYTLTRGVLCAMCRPPVKSVEEVCGGARRIVVIHGVTDTTNIGAIFRSAAALGIDGVLLTPDSCDPLNRRAVRVSMGSVFLIPWTWADAPLAALHRLGFRTAALALSDDSVPLDTPALKQEPRLALVMGTEGDGRHHRRSRLHGAHPDGARGGLAQRGGSIRRSVLGAAGKWNGTQRHGGTEFFLIDYGQVTIIFKTQINADYTYRHAGFAIRRNHTCGFVIRNTSKRFRITNPVLALRRITNPA